MGGGADRVGGGCSYPAHRPCGRDSAQSYRYSGATGVGAHGWGGVRYVKRLLVERSVRATLVFARALGASSLSLESSLYLE